MTTQATPDSAYEARAKALAVLIEAVDVYKAFQTLEPTGLVHDECGDGLDDAVCDAAVDLLDADAAYSEALEAEPPSESKTERPVVAGATLYDVKAAIIAAQKRTHVKAAQGVVMAHGGKAKNPDTGFEGPSLKALPPERFAACIAAIEALPATV